MSGVLPGDVGLSFRPPALPEVAGENEELAGRVKAHALFKDRVALIAQLFENLAVDLGHHPGGQQAVLILGRQQAFGLTVKAACAPVLQFHELNEALVMTTIEDFQLADAEVSQVFQRQVDAAVVAGVFSDVADDVGELEGVAEVDGVVYIIKPYLFKFIWIFICWF